MTFGEALRSRFTAGIIADTAVALDTLNALPAQITSAH